MNKSRLLMFSVVLALSLALVGIALAADNAQKPPPTEQVAFTGVAPSGNGVNSLSGSTVTFFPAAGGDTCYIPGATQTFCFNAHSYTNDWEYVYNVWLKFPADWQVTNAYVMGTPSCTGGGTWGDFSWSFQTAPYEMNISHARYQSTTDDCTATYCVEVVSGTGLPDAEQSWYWDGDSYGSPPHNPCSDDQYTPSGQNTCDQWVNPQAAIPPCAMDPGLYLLPESQEASGCNGVPQEHTISLLNNTGSAGTFNLTYSVPTADGILTGPASVTADQMEVVPFVVTLTPDLCVPNGDVVIGQVDAAGNAYTDTAWINKTIASEPSWEAILGSSPSWPGYGYPRDGCTAMNAAGDWVTYEFGDTTSIFGFWGYNHDTNTWFQPGAANTPLDRWAPDWAYDPDTNLCYVTGGANTPGGGTYNTAYVFDPVANSFTQLGNFTSIRDFHTSWVGTLEGVKYLCIGGGVNASSVLVQSTQCYDLAQAAPGSWNAENAQMAALPNDPFGAADGVLHAPGGDQFWYVGGAINNFATVTDEAYYWDDADNMWHSGGNTGQPRYRVEGDFLNGEFYFLGGSSGGFTPTSTAVKGTFDGMGWTWTNLPDMNNIRMDNVANMGDETMWSVDGYGASASAYVEKMTFCPLCDLQGWLEGTVLDGDTQLPLGAEGSCSAPESLTGSWVDFYPQAGGDACFTPGTQQTLCFKAESFSPDYEYVYNVWLKFPSDWTVNDVYVAGTPWCDNGTWGSFSWSFETAPYEVNIYHPRYQGSGGANCIANYCFEVTTGNTGFASWYWDGDNYGSVPHHPCSSDQYTPSGQVACDEWINPLASVTPCNGDLAPTCTNASVTINPGNLHVGVDPATGHYGPVMLIQGVYTVTATAPGYSTDEAVVYIADEMTTVQDFVLLRPVVDVEPTSISVSAPPNTPVVVPMVVTNNGSMPLDFEIVEFGSGLAGEAMVAKPQPAAATGVDPLILDQMAASADGKATFFVAFSGTADLAGADLYPDKPSKIEWVRNALRQAADTAQADVRAWLDSQGIAYQVFYIDNTLLLTADASVLEALKAFPGVSGFHGNHIYDLLPYSTDHPSATAGSLGLMASLHTVEPDAIIPWDLNIMSIPQVWDELGITGEGVIVANVDTGVDYDHEALFPNYLCGAGPHTNCWLDPQGGSTTPNDGHGHGTGTMSQMAADNNPAFQYAVGDAPDAGWIACAGCPGGSCPDTALNACADWLVMTTPNTPDVVNNSWGTWSALCDPWYDGKIAAYRAAGIVPVWAAGNIGNACGTSTPPANSIGTLAVGATTSSDVQAGFSSTGPGLCTGRTQFPDVSAPGDATCGAVSGGGYSCGFGGTSFAAPRAAGCLALMKSANPSLGVQELMDVLMATADNKLNQDCGAPQNDPNYRYGDGRVNCFAAVDAVFNADIPWVSTDPITGTIAPDTSQPVDVTFECTPDQQGFILTGELRINHNDPCADTVIVPIEMTCGDVMAPDIDVQPTSLADTLIEGESSVQQLDVHNQGTEALNWSIVEHDSGAATTPSSTSAPRAGFPVELKFGSKGEVSVETNPLGIEAPVNMVLDDASAENYIGLNDGIYGFQFIWLNRFTPEPNEFPFNLTDISVIMGATGVAVGDPIDLVVYEDTDGDGDPSDATWLATYNVTVQFNDGATWNLYPLTTPLLLSGPGDVLIGVINRYQVSGVEPSDFPAALDQTSSQQRSWVGAWSGDPPNPAILPPDAGGLWGLIDTWFPGNWMVRGYGETVAVPPECEPVDIPWASVDPTSGTTPGHSGFFVDVTFDATGMAAGDYNANLCVQSNDPDEPFVIVPLALTVLANQEIDVTPTSLFQQLAPDDTATQALNICNEGDLDLTWSLTEVPPDLGALSTPFVPVNVRGNGLDAPITAVSPSRPLVQVAPLSNPEDVLWNQPLSSVSQNAYVNQDFGDYPDYSSFLADDFANTENWYIDTIFIPGDGWNGFSSLFNATTLTWQIYADNGSGFPDGNPAGGGNPPVWTLTIQPTDPQVVISTGTPGGYMSNTTLNLATPITVPPGHWWLVFYPTMDFASGGQYGRQPADTLNGNVGKFINPGGGFGYGTAWQDWTVIGPTQSDIAFRLEGSATPPFDAEWLSEDPLAGTVTGHTCQVVDVTFDSTGLADGDYYAGLKIQSNDADEPNITVPVHLEVVSYVPEPEIVVNPTSLALTLFPNEVGLLTFNIGNIGDADLTWSLTDTGAWLTLDPTSGTVLPDGETLVEATFDATGLTAGTYNAVINITSNDGPVTVTVTLTVVNHAFYLPFLHK